MEADPQAVVAHPFALEDRVVIVTGGAKGIGRSYTEAFLAQGAKVVVADVDTDALAGVKEAAGEADDRVLAIRVDISSAADVEEMARSAREHFGRIDGLINNAGLMSTLARRAWHEIDEAEWDRVMEVNLRGLFLCCRAVYPQMKAQQYGKIVNISSGRIWEGTPNRLHYTTSKAGVIGFTRGLAREVGEDGICVNAVTPGLTRSDTQVASSTSEYLNSGYDSRRALKRAQVPEDLVGTVLYLCSPASDFVTGQTINVDGGYSMH